MSSMVIPAPLIGLTIMNSCGPELVAALVTTKRYRLPTVNVVCDASILKSERVTRTVGTSDAPPVELLPPEVVPPQAARTRRSKDRNTPTGSDRETCEDMGQDSLAKLLG